MTVDPLIFLEIGRADGMLQIQVRTPYLVWHVRHATGRFAIARFLPHN
jgi:hypothetical protein